MLFQAYGDTAMLQDYSKFSVNSVNNPQINLVVSLVARAANLLAHGHIMHRAKKQDVNPYEHEVFRGTRDFEKSMECAAWAARRQTGMWLRLLRTTHRPQSARNPRWLRALFRAPQRWASNRKPLAR